MYIWIKETTPPKQKNPYYYPVINDIYHNLKLSNELECLRSN
jgi:hypothetical protein